jgi:hypothetical protein
MVSQKLSVHTGCAPGTGSASLRVDAVADLQGMLGGGRLHLRRLSGLVDERRLRCSDLKLIQQRPWTPARRRSWGSE